MRAGVGGGGCGRIFGCGWVFLRMGFGVFGFLLCCMILGGGGEWRCTVDDPTASAEQSSDMVTPWNFIAEL